jgi:flagellar hook assembly protein FlgD
MLGRTVRTLLLGMQPAGNRLIAWDGRNDAGEAVPAGTYLYRFEAGGRQLFKSLSIMK